VTSYIYNRWNRDPSRLAVSHVRRRNIAAFSRYNIVAAIHCSAVAPCRSKWFWFRDIELSRRIRSMMGKLNEVSTYRAKCTYWWALYCSLLSCSDCASWWFRRAKPVHDLPNLWIWPLLARSINTEPRGIIFARYCVGVLLKVPARISMVWTRRA
jgi:hypothetical protein